MMIQTELWSIQMAAVLQMADVVLRLGLVCIGQMEIPGTLFLAEFIA